MERREVRDPPTWPAPQAYVRTAILLRLRDAPTHGYELRSLLGGDVSRLYRLLRRLEGEGLVVSGWQPSAAGPARRIYRLTDEGATAMHRSVGPLREAHALIGALLDHYDGSRRRTRTGAA